MNHKLIQRVVIVFAMLFLFFATSLEAKKSRLGFILPKDSLSVPLKEKIISFIKQIHQTELADTNFILIHEPYILDNIYCLQELFSDSSFYTKEDFDFIKEKIKSSSFVWTSDMFHSVRIMSKNATNEFFKDRRRKGYYSFSVPIFLIDDTYCLFYSDYHCGYDCGEGHFKLYRNEKGKWTEVKTYCKWIS